VSDPWFFSNMPFLIRLLMAMVGSLLALTFALILIVAINMRVYGTDAFEHNAGARFAVFIEWGIAGFPLAMITFFVVLRSARRIRWLRGNTD